MSVQKGDIKIFYEFKSVKEFPANFTQQFVKDLQNIDEIENLRWIFEKRGNINNSKLKEKVMSALENTNVITDDIAKELLNQRAIADDLLNLIDDKFAEIFIIANF